MTGLHKNTKTTRTERTERILTEQENYVLITVKSRRHLFKMNTISLYRFY